MDSRKDALVSHSSLLGVLHGNERLMSRDDLSTRRYNEGYLSVGKTHYTNDPKVQAVPSNTTSINNGTARPALYADGDEYPYNERLVADLIAKPNEIKTKYGNVQLSAAEIRGKLDLLDGMLEENEKLRAAEDEILQSRTTSTRVYKNAFVSSAKSLGVHIKKAEIGDDGPSQIKVNHITAIYSGKTESQPLEPFYSTPVPINNSSLEPVERGMYQKIIRDHKLRNAQHIAAAGCIDRLALHKDLSDWITGHAKREISDRLIRKRELKSKKVNNSVSSTSSSADATSERDFESDNELDFASARDLAKLHTKLAADAADGAGAQRSDEIFTMDSASWTAMGRAVDIVQSSVEGIFGLIKALKNKALSLAEIEEKLANEASRLSNTREFMSSLQGVAGIRTASGSVARKDFQAERVKKSDSAVVQVSDDKTKLMFEQRKVLLSRKHCANSDASSNYHDYTGDKFGNLGLVDSDRSWSFEARSKGVSPSKQNPLKRKGANPGKESPTATQFSTRSEPLASPFGGASDFCSSRRLSEYHFGSPDYPLAEDSPCRRHSHETGSSQTMSAKPAPLSITLLQQKNIVPHLPSNTSLPQAQNVPQSPPRQKWASTVQVSLHSSPAVAEDADRMSLAEIQDLKRRCAWQSVAISLLLRINKRKEFVKNSPETASLERKGTSIYRTHSVVTAVGLGDPLPPPPHVSNDDEHIIVSKNDPEKNSANKVGSDTYKSTAHRQQIDSLPEEGNVASTSIAEWPPQSQLEKEALDDIRSTFQANSHEGVNSDFNISFSENQIDNIFRSQTPTLDSSLNSILKGFNSFEIDNKTDKLRKGRVSTANTNATISDHPCPLNHKQLAAERHFTPHHPKVMPVTTPSSPINEPGELKLNGRSLTRKMATKTKKSETPKSPSIVEVDTREVKLTEKFLFANRTTRSPAIKVPTPPALSNF